MLVDFHVHSTASDGSYRPDAIARMTDGFAYAALTDHDTCDGAAAFLDEPSGGGPCRRIAGIELSIDPGEGFDMFHLLGLGIDPEDRGLADFRLRILAAREERNAQIVDNFARLGIDLGGTNIAVGVVNEQNEIIGTASVKTNAPRPAEEIADSMREACLLALGEARMTLDDVASVGVGTPGAVNEEGVVEFSANLGFNDTPLRDLVEERLNKPTYIENDANCAALGEQVAGCGGGVPNFVAVTLGTGVGGGIILGGKLLTGINGAAGEIGHMSVEMDGIPCPCGRSGCFEQYASATALVRQTREAMEQDRDRSSKLWELAEGDLDNVNGLVLFNAAHAGDGRALMVLDKFTTYLAVGVADLINIFQPDVLCIGGGISRQGDFLIEPLARKVEELRYTKHSKKQTKICAATLGNDAGIIGAALLSDVK